MTYSKLTPIQTGTFSTVYKAWSSQRNEYVALKIMPKSKYSSGGMANEFEIMKILGRSHPNICSMLDFYQDTNYYVLVLEYCEYGDLYDFLSVAKRQGDQIHPSTIQLDFAKVLRQISSAIMYSHSLGIAHRDIKPENILLTKEGDIKLADWGHAIRDSFSKESHIGTDNYRAPETFDCTIEYDTFKIDYWSLGVTSLYLIFGQAPFKNLTLSSDLADCHMREEKNYLMGSNYSTFARDPNEFIYKYYLAPIINLKKDMLYQYRDAKVPLYVWRDLADIYNLFYISRILVDSLIVCEPEERSLKTFLFELNRENGLRKLNGKIIINERTTAHHPMMHHEKGSQVQLVNRTLIPEKIT
ncbi:hypothetical protein NCAS_0A02180 [Naumovozyma castellii]|uniref:Protein kinase domain-containing protein n=1 Tax=Naumovozyma castellii TaxID=27288 RepID=G0V5N8_NAUCA|nr:hypothetical protein NCAS_0A02180 [Naumovozyma castellii CBS 4309]CCC66776.1 hypothetical protein NCAS_0A02180 [Naumovozyma castellii CBS 4309]